MLLFCYLFVWLFVVCFLFVCEAPPFAILHLFVRLVRGLFYIVCCKFVWLVALLACVPVCLPACLRLCVFVCLFVCLFVCVCFFTVLAANLMAQLYAEALFKMTTGVLPQNFCFVMFCCCLFLCCLCVCLFV